MPTTERRRGLVVLTFQALADFLKQAGYPDDIQALDIWRTECDRNNDQCTVLFTSRDAYRCTEGCPAPIMTPDSCRDIAQYRAEHPDE